MKKVFLLVLLSILVFVLTSCQKPEDATLSRYFSAMSHNDRDTMSAMAAEPVSLEFNSWKLVEVKNTYVEDAPLPGLIEQMEELKKTKQDQLLVVRDKKDLIFDLELKEKETRNRAQKQKIQAEIEEANEMLLAEEDKFRQIQSEENALKRRIDFEKRMVTLSASIDNNQELFKGEVHTSEVLVRITSDAGERDYVITLKKHMLHNPVTDRITPSRFVIFKIQTLEEFRLEKEKESMPTEEVEEEVIEPEIIEEETGEEDDDQE